MFIAVKEKQMPVCSHLALREARQQRPQQQQY
jgi:hypothetical protein